MKKILFLLLFVPIMVTTMEQQSRPNPIEIIKKRLMCNPFDNLSRNLCLHILTEKQEIPLAKTTYSPLLQQWGCINENHIIDPDLYIFIQNNYAIRRALDGRYYLVIVRI